MEEFRARLLAFESLNSLRQICRDLAKQEFEDAFPLPLFIVRSILEGVHERLAGRPVETATWSQVQDALIGHLEAVLDAHKANNRQILFDRLNTLVRRWLQTQRELLE